jgi:hypothetical protein
VTSVATSIGRRTKWPSSGCGGGRDILTALGTRTKAIDAIELNRATVTLLRGALREFSAASTICRA